MDNEYIILMWICKSVLFIYRYNIIILSYGYCKETQLPSVLLLLVNLVLRVQRLFLVCFPSKTTEIIMMLKR